MDRIEPDRKVADVVDRHPETVEVFLRHECPATPKSPSDALETAVDGYESITWLPARFRHVFFLPP